MQTDNSEVQNNLSYNQKENEKEKSEEKKKKLYDVPAWVDVRDVSDGDWDF